MDTEGLWGRIITRNTTFRMYLRCSLLLFAFWSDGSHGPPPHPQTPSLLRSHPALPLPSQPSYPQSPPQSPMCLQNPMQTQSNHAELYHQLTPPSCMNRVIRSPKQSRVPPRPASSGSPTLPTHREPAEAPNLGTKLNRICELLIGRVAQRLLQNLAAVKACACCLIYKPAGRWHLIQKARRCYWCYCWC